MNRNLRTTEEDWDLKDSIAVINGEEYPLFYAKIINKMLDEEQPFFLFVGKPGKGKTMASTRLAYDLTEKLNFFKGKYTFEQNIFYDNKKYMKAILNNQKKSFHKIDINTTLHISNYHQDVNRTFENMVNLCRIKGNLITGDGQYLWQMDRGIQDTHTFRAVPGDEKYSWKIYYIDREPDSRKRKAEKKPLQTWKPEMPPERISRKIRKRDKEVKEDTMRTAIEGLEGEDDLEVV